MSKEIRKVRNAIKTRKKKRNINNAPNDLLSSVTLTDEEKYSPYPEIPYEVERFHRPGEEKPHRAVSMSLLNKFIISSGLFFFSFLLLKTELIGWEQPKKWLEQSLQEEFPFAAVHEWYVENLGIPLSLVPQERMVIDFTDGVFDTPLSGEVVESFQTNGAGIMISPENEARIHAVNKGIVIFAGKKADTDKTVVIQHADGTETTYGMLSTIDVHLYQIVEANQVIGMKNPQDENKAVFFSIEKENHYIDPAKVIRVDEVQ